ncbi:MAG: hypothetical protein H6579_10355 [Chitinophagales bacterium]|nr:hypothetical protein [Chitinophagales bacterium]
MKRVILSFLLLVVIQAQIFAQCAMCKASAETSLDAGANEAAGINAGVLYVLVITFGVLASLAFLFFRGQEFMQKD